MAATSVISLGILRERGAVITKKREEKRSLLLDVKLCYGISRTIPMVVILVVSFAILHTPSTDYVCPSLKGIIDVSVRTCFFERKQNKVSGIFMTNILYVYYNIKISEVLVNYFAQ